MAKDNFDPEDNSGKGILDPENSNVENDYKGVFTGHNDPRLVDAQKKLLLQGLENLFHAYDLMELDNKKLNQEIILLANQSKEALLLIRALCLQLSYYMQKNNELKAKLHENEPERAKRFEKVSIAIGQLNFDKVTNGNFTPKDMENIAKLLIQANDED